MTIQQICRSREEVVRWDLIFRRNLQDWEMEEFHSLVEILYGLDRPNNTPDVWRWRESRFTVKSYYKRLLVRGTKFPSLLYLDPQSFEKGLFLRVVGSKGSDFDGEKSEKEEDHLC